MTDSTLQAQAKQLLSQVLALAEEATSDGYNDAEALIVGALTAAQAEGQALRDAAAALYMAGRWEAVGVDGAPLWEALRDALRLPAGTATVAGVGAAPADGARETEGAKGENDGD